MAKSGKKKQKKANRKATRTIVKTVRAPPRVVTKVVNAKPKKSLGSRIGGKIGSFIGSGAQSLFKHITGFGDYKISGNSLMAGQVPMVSNVATAGGTIVRHREYIGDIIPSTNFTLTSFSINPGNTDLFPWLSAVASAYEEYAFRGLIFEYKAMSGSAFLGTAGNVGLGTIIMATQYNVLFPDFPDKRTMENYEFACSNKPNQDFIHPIECDPKKAVLEHLYVQAAGQSTLGDQRFYDLGNFQYATQGFDSAATGIVGELWATYEVELFKPKLTQTLGTSVPSDRFTGSGAITQTQPIPANSTTATGFSTNLGSTCGCMFSISGTNLVLFFPINCIGTYLIFFEFGYSAQTITSVFTASAANGGATLIKNYGAGPSGSQISACGGALVTVSNDIPNQQASVTWGWTTTGTPTGTVVLDWYVTQLAYSILNPSTEYPTSSLNNLQKQTVDFGVHLQSEIDKLNNEIEDLAVTNVALNRRIKELKGESKSDQPNAEGLQRLFRDHVSSLANVKSPQTESDNEDNFSVVPRTFRRRV